MIDFEKSVDAIERQLANAIVGGGDPDKSIGALILAITALLELVKTQHEQIVDLNSRVEYRYTRRDLARE